MSTSALLGPHTYAKVRRDFEYLESIAELEDWVTLMDELTAFMREPTKAFAGGLYVCAIGRWFDEHGIPAGDKRARKIALENGRGE